MLSGDVPATLILQSGLGGRCCRCCVQFCSLCSLKPCMAAVKKLHPTVHHDAAFRVAACVDAGVRLRSNPGCGPLPPPECDLNLPFIESQLIAIPDEGEPQMPSDWGRLAAYSHGKLLLPSTFSISLNSIVLLVLPQLILCPSLP